jgi:hypothetical protein
MIRGRGSGNSFSILPKLIGRMKCTSGSIRAADGLARVRERLPEGATLGSSMVSAPIFDGAGHKRVLGASCAASAVHEVAVHRSEEDLERRRRRGSEQLAGSLPQPCLWFPTHREDYSTGRLPARRQLHRRLVLVERRVLGPLGRAAGDRLSAQPAAALLGESPQSLLNHCMPALCTRLFGSSGYWRLAHGSRRRTGCRIADTASGGGVAADRPLPSRRPQPLEGRTAPPFLPAGTQGQRWRARNRWSQRCGPPSASATHATRGCSQPTQATWADTVLPTPPRTGSYHRGRAMSAAEVAKLAFPEMEGGAPPP